MLQLPAGNQVQAFADNGNNKLYATMTGNRIYSTTNNGINWLFSGIGLDSTHIYSISAKDSLVFLSAQNGIYRSTDYGISFIHLLNDIGAWTSKAIIIIENNIYAGFLNGLYKSTNFGNNWVMVNNGFPQYPYVISLSYSNNNFYAGLADQNAGIYKSTNLGENWVRINNGIPNIYPYSIYSNSNLVMVGTALGVYISTNYGSNWRLIPEIPGNIGLFGLTSAGTQNIFISAWDKGVYASTNGGLNWVSKNEGLMSLRVTAMYIFTDYVYLGTNPYDYSREILRRPVSEMVPVIENNPILPTDYKLYQNYPNPFNPVTKIKFEIPSGFPLGARGNDRVVLKVYDILGKEIATLVNEKLQPGTFEVRFEGSNLPSGVYFYRLTTEGFSETKKMILLK
jgi:photosystem II stability/assembly factor-like uncharacterized protein